VSVLLNNSPQARDGVAVIRDIVYYDGPYANPQRENLDIYLPPNEADYPVIFLAFGGAFHNGEKSRQAYLAQTLAREGYGVVAINHRITDGSHQQVVFPGEEVDVARAFAWTYSHIAAYGGDPSKIVLLGHSSGAMLLSLLVTDRSYLAAQGLSPDVIRGVIGVSSGTYDMRIQFDNPALPDVSDVFGDLEQFWNASPLKYVDGTQPPFLILYASNDVPGFAQDSTAFYQALVNAGSQAELHMIPGRNHQMIIGDAARPGDPARDIIMRFIAEHTTAPPRVASVRVNDGSAQRSMVTSLTVTFSTVVTLDPGTFALVRQDGTLVGLNVTPSVFDGRTVAVLTFIGDDVVAGSLADGSYTLITHAGLIHDDFGRGLAEGDRTDAFFRLFGDSNGDGHVDVHDLLRFAGSFGKRTGDPGFLAYFDYNGDGRVDFGDLLQLLLRVGH
jgi:acetyl esterase/lipase